MPTDIDWQQWCQKNQSKHDPLLENCHLSGGQKHWQQHKLQEMTTTRAWNTFKTQYSKNKICLVKVKFRSKHISGKEKRESLLFKKKFRGYVSHYHELMRCVWPVNTNFKKLVNQAFSNPEGRNLRTSFLLSKKFKYFLSFSFISETFGTNWKDSQTASSKEHDCMMPGHQTNMPESRQNNALSVNQYWKATFMLWTWEELDQWTGNRSFIFLLPLSRNSCLSCVLHKMQYSPCLAHKAPVLQVWIELAIYRYLAWKPTLQLQNIFGVWLFEKVWEISCQQVRAWETWNCETHNKVVRLGMPICIKYTGFLIFCVVTEPQNSSKSAKFTKTRKIPPNSVEILSNTCLYNIFETHFSYWGYLIAINLQIQYLPAYKNLFFQI